MKRTKMAAMMSQGSYGASCADTVGSIAFLADCYFMLLPFLTIVDVIRAVVNEFLPFYIVTQVIMFYIIYEPCFSSVYSVPFSSSFFACRSDINCLFLRSF